MNQSEFRIMTIFVAKNYLWPLVQLDMSQNPMYMRGLDWAATQAKYLVFT